METKIKKKADLIARNLDTGYENVLFAGSMSTNLEAKGEDLNNGLIAKNSKGEELNVVIDTDKTKWKNTKEYKKHWNSIRKLQAKLKADGLKNVAQFPDDYYTLIEKIALDITRMRMQELDYTALITQEVVRFDFSKSVDLQEFLGFAGVYLENNLAGDSVPLIEQKTGVEGTVTMQGYALGHVRTLEDILYNTSIYSLQKVNEAFVRAYVSKRNDLVIGPMIALTDAAGWDASQTVAADATAGLTLEERIYRTLNDAINTISDLYDFQTRKEIDLTKLVLLTGKNSDARNVDRAIRGVLQATGEFNSNREALEIDEVWLYKGDTIFYGKEKVVYKGIAAGKSYLFVPGPSGAPNYTLVKRPPTEVTSPGDAANLSTEKRSRYWIQTKYNDEFYGTSSSNTVIAADTSENWGYIIEVNIPTS